MKSPLKWDERHEQVAGRSAMVMLGLTQIALGAIVLIRLYVLDQPDNEVRDLQWVLLGSIAGYFILRSFLGGMIPLPTWKQALLAYAGMFILLFTILSIWFGLPELRDWATTILPVVLGPAIIVGGYWLIAYLGKRHVDRESLDE